MSRLKLSLIVSGIVVLIVALSTSVVFLFGVYNLHWEGPIVTRIAQVLPIPAAKLGSRSVLLRDYFADLASIKKYLSSDQAATQNQRRPLIDDDRKSALERLIQEEAIEELAATRNITVTDEQTAAVMTELNVTATSTANFQDFISTNYGWSLDDFKAHIVRPLVLTRLLAASYATDHGGDQSALTAYLTERVARPDVVRYIKFK